MLTRNPFFNQIQNFTLSTDLIGQKDLFLKNTNKKGFIEITPEELTLIGSKIVDQFLSEFSKFSPYHRDFNLKYKEILKKF